jgi:predicted phage terminase large subunit-like protein
VLFPPWWLTRHPESSIIAAAHTADLAAHFGRQVHATVREHEERLGYAIVGRGGGAATRWRTSTGGQYFGTGVRGPMIGRRADLVIIDDPVKSHHDADSARARARLWEWYRSELLTRLRPGARVVLIMTRWHTDDLGGRLLAQDHEDWHCLRLPALAEAEDPMGRVPGEPLWPEWEDAKALARKRAAVGERTWSAQYQQRPMPLDGTPFRIERFDLISRPATLMDAAVVRAWDLAATPTGSNGDPDWTVGLKLLREQSGRFVVLDLVRLRASPFVVEQTILRTAAEDGVSVTVGIPQDPGQAGKMQVAALTGRLAGFRVVSSRETGSKWVRALPVVSQIEAGNFALVRADWNADFLEELGGFPHGAKDDQVDALSRAFSLLLEQGAAARRIDVPLLQR